MITLEQNIINTKQARINCDSVIQFVKELKSSRETSIAITKLQEATMWLGMNLKRINDENPGSSPNPYPNSRNTSNTIIEPTADNIKL